jgi:uncharacterized protein with beta-barrel porin domain
VAPAIFAQSIGSGGGSGGSSVSNANSGSYFVNMALGGAANGSGGNVLAASTGTVVSVGALSYGVLAQSVGSGGGAVGSFSTTQAGGGDTSVTMTLGSGTSSGGVGGAVSFTGSGAIATRGANASAVVAQSVGGGGGVAGSANTSNSSGSVAATFALGASGGSGSGFNGGSVTVSPADAESLLTIETSGLSSFGMVAQSVGGGGGLATSVTTSTGPSATIAATLGASGGPGGLGGAVNVTSTVNISTNGVQSPGLLAQSVGGGGGILAASASSAFTGTTTLGTSASSLYGPGGAVSVNMSGRIATAANLSSGIIAQSVSGGGGLSLAGASAISLGSTAGDSSGATPNAVVLTNNAAITTSGAASIGLVAQSVGGGGGLAVSSGGAATLGGAPSGALSGGAVTVTSSGRISTTGDNAFGILAQSVGGGGGAVLSTGNSVTPTFVAGNGSSEAVTVTVNAPITTTGAGAHAVVAQSVAGGGGLVMNGNTSVLQSGGGAGSSGLVTVNMNATTTASGQGSNAVVLQSTTDPILNVAQNVLVLGGRGGSAVVFEGPTNILNNSGSLATVDGSGGLAIRTISGDTTVNNAGLILGSVRLASGASNLLHNQSGGMILAGLSLDLGGTGVLRNDGVLANGGAGVGATAINGSMTQSPSGTLVVRFDRLSGTSDAFNVTGSANIQGTIMPVIVNPGLTAPGSVSTPFLTAGGGLTISANGLSLSPAPSAIMSYSLSTTGGGVSLVSTANFAPAGLSASAQRIGNLIGTVQSSGQPQLQQATAALVTIPTVSGLNQAYWNISGGGVSSISTVVSQLSTSFMTLMLNPFGGSADRNPATQSVSRQFGGKEKVSLFGTQDTVKQDLIAQVTKGTSAAKPEDDLAVPPPDEERWKIWAQAYGATGTVAGNSSTGVGNLSASTYGFATGFDYHPNSSAMFGFALAGGSTNFGLSNGLSGGSSVLQLGLYGSQQFGAGYISGALSYAFHDFATTRSLQFMNGIYTAGFNAHNVGARIESGYRFATPVVGITPYAAIQGNAFFTPNYSEMAIAGSTPALALNYNQRSYTELRTELGFWFDKLFDLDNDAKLAFRVRTAWAHVGSNNPDVSAGFQTLQGASFSVNGTPPVSNLAVLLAGAEYRLATGVAIGAVFGGEFSGTSQSYSANATVRFRW